MLKFQEIALHHLQDVLLCSECKPAPSFVAHFDFEATRDRDQHATGQHTVFRGIVEMRADSDNVIFQNVSVEVNAVSFFISCSLNFCPVDATFMITKFM